MSDYQDLGQYIMKLFDDLITNSKNQINEARNNFIRELPRKLSSRSTVSVMMVEGLIQEISDQLLRINQDNLNNYSISIAKKARSASKKRTETTETKFEENKELLGKKMKEIEGLHAQIHSLEKKSQNLEQEKEEMLKHFSKMNSRITELETLNNTSKEEFEYQIEQLNTQWELKFKQNQEEWDSYIKLKLAEKEVRESSERLKSVESDENIKPEEVIGVIEAIKATEANEVSRSTPIRKTKELNNEKKPENE